MAAPAPPQKRKLFLGTFIHSVSLDTLEYLHNHAVFVGRDGRILHIEPACDRARAESDIYPQLGWTADGCGDQQVEVTVADHDGLDFFFPGFVDTHIHAPQYPNAGIFGKSTLLNWLDTYTFPAEAAMGGGGADGDGPPPRARCVYSTCVRRTLAHGTTTACYFATIHVPATNLLADLCLAAGQRALVGRVCMDRLGPPGYLDESPADAVAKTEATIAYIQSRAGAPVLAPSAVGSNETGTQMPPLVEPCITPRFAPACTPALLSALGALRRDHPTLAAQTHVSENQGEIALVRREYARLPPPAGGCPAEGTYVGAYARAAGLLGPRTVLAHGAWLCGAEADALAAAGAGIAHCPCSNGALTSGEARVRWLLGRGVGVGLGTDVSGGWSPSVLEAARHAVLVSNRLAMPERGSVAVEPADDDDDDGGGGHEEGKEGGAHRQGAEEEERARQKLGAEEVLHLATRGGARVLGLGGRVGGFEVGMEWDAQLIGLARVPPEDVVGGGHEEEEEEENDDSSNSSTEDRGNVDIFGWETWEERVAKWLFNGDDRNTRKVWVRGRLVHARRR